MARPKSFDEDKVLDAAVDCFWTHGLKSASIRDLADQMGIAGPSLYNAYGCKRELFAKALERYADAQMRASLAELEAAHAPKRAIEAFFSRAIDKVLGSPGSRGCMLARTAMEAEPQDRELCAPVAAYLDELQAFFLRNIEAGQADASIPHHLAAGDMAKTADGAVPRPQRARPPAPRSRLSQGRGRSRP